MARKFRYIVASDKAAATAYIASGARNGSPVSDGKGGWAYDANNFAAMQEARQDALPVFPDACTLQISRDEDWK